MNSGIAKSSIQVLGELLTLKNQLFESLENLVENYTIESNIFCAGENGCHELTTGYAGVVADYNTLDEAYKEFNVCNQALWIHNGVYSVCNLYKSLSEARESKIIDIKNKQMINA